MCFALQNVHTSGRLSWGGCGAWLACHGNKTVLLCDDGSSIVSERYCLLGGSVPGETLQRPQRCCHQRGLQPQ